MTKLSMHEPLPFDEETTPPRVSTGELPRRTRCGRRRHGGVRALPHRTMSGAVADYIPVLAGASPELFGISVVGVRGRSFEIGDVDTRFSIQSVSKPFVFALVCEAIGYGEARRHLGVNSTGFPFDSLMAVELNGDRTMNPLVNAGAMATTSLVPGRHGGREVGADPRRAVPVRRPRAHASTRRSTPPSPRPTCATRASPTCWRATAASTSTPTRPPTSTPGSARWR